MTDDNGYKIYRAVKDLLQNDSKDGTLGEYTQPPRGSISMCEVRHAQISPERLLHRPQKCDFYLLNDWTNGQTLNDPFVCARDLYPVGTHGSS